MLTLDGKIAVVTGALGGMGRAVCQRFGAEGASVVGMDWTDEGSELFAKEMAQAGSKFEFRKVDVSSAVEVDEAAEVVAAQYGSIDVLYNNAGLMQLKPILETSNYEWDRILDVNLKSVFLMTRAFAPLMADRSGSIINLSSTGALRAWDSLSVYGAAKAGVIQFSKVAAVEFAPNIRVNVVCPGMIDTPMARGFAAGLPNPETAWETMSQQTVLQRFGQSSEIADLALWLASDQSSFVTGEEIAIDGGSILR
jgi:3-oxoacyl-[acyl-carrier protein] reductase/cyclopentanol dehydrogenase/dihydroanticapsin dehydrogenase